MGVDEEDEDDIVNDEPSLPEELRRPESPLINKEEEKESPAQLIASSTDFKEDEEPIAVIGELQDELSELNLKSQDGEPEVDWDSMVKLGTRRTVGSYATSTTSTIHPDVIKERVKKTIVRRDVVQSLSRIRAKGEASAATRKKRENKDLIRSDGIWGWDN